MNDSTNPATPGEETDRNISPQDKASPETAEALEQVELPTPTIKVRLSPDKMQAFLTISQDPPTPYQVTTYDVYNALAEANVEFGVMIDKIEQIVADQAYPQQVVIAEGKPPVPGENGRLEYLFSRARGGHPEEVGYRVDHYNLQLTENVTAGQLLALKIPAVPGEAGMTVSGRPIPAPKVRDVKLPAGKGTKVSETNPLELVAENDGFVRLDRSSFEKVVVEQLFNVYGNVDMSTGHLDIEGSVHIRQNVRAGFNVKATGDIIVEGLVKNCHLQAGGRIEVKGGIIGGQKRATLKAGEDIVVKFADQADITAGISISITDEALNCNLQAEHTVRIGSEGRVKGALVGGRATAGHEIRAVSVGNGSGTRTYLRVGERPTLLIRRHKMQAEIDKQQEELNLIETQLQALVKKQAERAPARQSRDLQRAALGERQATLYQDMKNLLAKIQAEGALTEFDHSSENLQSEVEATRNTLERVDSQITAIMSQGTGQGDAGSLSPQAETLGKLEHVRQGLRNKLAELEASLARQKQQWAKIPRSQWRELEVTRASLESLGEQIAKLETEDILDQKIEHAIPQLQAKRNTLAETIAVLQDELEALKEEIAVALKQQPKIIITDKLWAGTEVNILGQRHRFNTTEESVQVQLSIENDAIITRYFDPKKEG